MPTPPDNPRLAARRARVQRIRMRVAAGAAAVFVAVFGGLYGQLRSGNDPALAKSATATTTAATAVPSPVTTAQS